MPTPSASQFDLPVSRSKHLNSSTYRADIDGLRAIAILLVILDHLQFKYAAGGFIGVDIFFVISGFLIVGDIARRLEAGSFSLAAFYERRFRRIVPALTVMLAVVSVLALEMLFPLDIQRFAKSLIAAACCCSNLLFAATKAGYFDVGSSDLLIHTWSLGVEEQFYLVVPLCMMLAAKWSGNIKLWFLITAGISLGAASVMTLTHLGQPFYMPYTRAWELLVGAMLALGMVSAPRSRLLRNAVAILSIVIFGAFTVFYSNKIPFPGIAALPPCLAAMFLMACGDGETSIVNRALSASPLVFTGKISYSLYLWHWPVICAVRMGLIPHITYSTPIGNLSIVVISFILATVSWIYVETPFRFGSFKLLKRSTCFALAGTAMFGLSLLGIAFLQNMGWPNRFNADELRLASLSSAKQDMREGSCFFVGPFSEFDKRVCLRTVQGQSNILLLGDSHAAALWIGLKNAFPSANFMQANAAACHPTLGSYGHSPCSQFRKFLFQDYLPQHPPDAVVISERWSAEENPYDFMPAVRYFTDRGIPVVVIGPVPEYTESLPLLLAWGLKFGRTEYASQNRTHMAEDLDSKLQKILEGLPGVQYVSMVQAICHSSQCREFVDTQDSVPMLFDSDHLSNAASVQLIQALRQKRILRF